MLRRIRLAMLTGTFQKLPGEAVVDETYTGRNARNLQEGKRKATGRDSVGEIAVTDLLTAY